MVARLSLLVFVLAALVGCGASGTVRSDDGPTPAGGSTAEAEDASDESSSEDTTTTADETTTTEAATTTTAPAAVEPSTSPYLTASDDVFVPDGEPGELSIVIIGTPDGGSVPVAVRNRTDDTLYGVGVSGTARGADGSLIGSGQDQGFAPTTVEPGEWAFGYVYIGFDDLPGDAEFDFTATADTDAGFLGSLDAIVVEHTKTQGSFSEEIVGIVQNDHNTEMSGPVSILVGCFTADGTQMTSTQMSFTDTDTIAAGGTSSFSVGLYDTECPVYVIGASGYDF